ncbi:MAG TPA: hypothetical protein VF534_01685 [Paraburkholderia sp.]
MSTLRKWYVYLNDRLYAIQYAHTEDGAIKAAAEQHGIETHSLTASTTIRSKAANEQPA